MSLNCCKIVFDRAVKESSNSSRTSSYLHFTTYVEFGSRLCDSNVVSRLVNKTRAKSNQSVSDKTKLY